MARNPFLERWDTPEGRDAQWEALLWLQHGGARPAGFGLTEQGRLDLRGLVVPEPVELAKTIVAAAGPAASWEVAEVSGRPTVVGREWVDVDLSFSWLPWLDVQESVWRNCRFDDAVLRDSRIWDSEVTGCSFERSDFRNVAVGNSLGAREVWWREISFRKAVMTGGVYFSGWRAEDVHFEGARISSMKFAQGSLIGAVFAGKLNKVEFDHRNMPDRPASTPLTRCDFSAAVFTEVDMRNVRLDDVVFPPGVFAFGNYPAVAAKAHELLPGEDVRGVSFVRSVLDLRPARFHDAEGFQVITRADLFQEGPDDPVATLFFEVTERAARAVGAPLILDGGRYPPEGA